MLLVNLVATQYIYTHRTKITIRLTARKDEFFINFKFNQYGHK